MHRFWSFPHATWTWNIVGDKSGLCFKPPSSPIRSPSVFPSWLLDWIGDKQDNMLQVVFTVLYQLWLARNNAREAQRIEEPVTIAAKSLVLVAEWRNVQELQVPTPSRRNERWCFPDEGWIKANVDGAFVKSDSSGGGGVVLFYETIVETSERELAIFSPPWLTQNAQDS